VTDAHCHIFPRNDENVSRRFVCATTEDDWSELTTLPCNDIPFFGVHPWNCHTINDIESFKDRLSKTLESNPRAGVGETGLDRLKDKNISTLERRLFSAHLEVAAKLRRPVVLHGAKCWGETFNECAKYSSQIPSFLFHGFSRSGGLIKDIVSINGYFSIGRSILNDHAINYQNLVKTLPVERILIESDYDGKKDIPHLPSIAEKISAKPRNCNISICETGRS
jgi:TatD DNase family protein